MELTDGMDWPPLPPEVVAAQREWDAWYRGSADKLDAVYGRAVGANIRPAQLAGGLVGGAARMLWGNPVPQTKKYRIHLPLPADIAAASSDLLFGQELPITYPDAPGAAVDRMNYILEGNQWQSLLSESGELSAALGGTYLRLGWDEEVADHALITVMDADGAVPTFSYGHLREVTFWTVVDKTGHLVFRHLETHRPGAIEHSLWEGTKDKLGRRVPLAESPVTADLPVDSNSTIVTGIKELTAVYIPNVRPTPMWRDVREARYLGRSDFGVQGVTTLFNGLDETWTSWMRDIRHARSRIFASRAALESSTPGGGAYFDSDREVYESLNVPPGEDPSVDKMISAQQFTIRVEEHARTIKELTLAAVSSCGYSGSTFGLDNEVAKTATEVGAVRQRTTETREKKTRYWTPALERFLRATANLDAVVFGGGTADTDVNVEFPPSSTPSQLELAQTAVAFRGAQAASTKTLVELIHPDWDEKQVQDEVALITSESAPAPIEIAPADALDPATETPDTPEGEPFGA